MGRASVVLCASLAFFFLASPGRAADAPQCRGAGLRPDAPLYYLELGKDFEGPRDHAGPEWPQVRPSIEEALEGWEKKPRMRTVCLQPEALEEMKRRAGIPETWYFSVEHEAVTVLALDVNHDGLADFITQDPVLQVDDHVIFAACGDNYYTPVASFANRYTMDSPFMLALETRVRSIRGVRWDEYSFIGLSPFKQLYHDAPDYDWARRVIGYDPEAGFYRELSAEPLP